MSKVQQHDIEYGLANIMRGKKIITCQKLMKSHLETNLMLFFPFKSPRDIYHWT